MSAPRQNNESADRRSPRGDGADRLDNMQRELLMGDPIPTKDQVQSLRDAGRSQVGTKGTDENQGTSEDRSNQL